MRMDVTDLRAFYASHLGRAARRMIVRRMTALWPHARSMDVLGFGYATPFLSPYTTNARSVIAAMPALQGSECWPPDGPMRAVLCEECQTPFRESQFDRVIVAHAVEETGELSALLTEMLRVTAPSGRMLIIAANRRGLWSRVDSTPFGHGRPFTKGQLNSALRKVDWEPVAWSRAVYAPPIRSPAVARAVRTMERIGERVVPRLGGVLMIEAVKRVVQPATGAKILRPVFRPAPEPIAAPTGARGAHRRVGLR